MEGTVAVSHFPGKAFSWRPFLLCGLPPLLIPSRLETAWPSSGRQAVKFQVGRDWLGVGLGREMEDDMNEGSLPGRAQLLHRAGHVSWALACSSVKLAGEHPVTGLLWGW